MAIYRRTTGLSGPAWSRGFSAHHIFTRDGVEEILNLQPRGSLAKAYQVKQVRNVIVQYKLAEELDAE